MRIKPKQTVKAGDVVYIAGQKGRAIPAEYVSLSSKLTEIASTMNMMHDHDRLFCCLSEVREMIKKADQDPKKTLTLIDRLIEKTIDISSQS